MRINKLVTLIRTVMAIVIALALALVIILLVSDTPFEAFKYLLLGPVMRLTRLANVVEMMLPLLFTGLSVSLISRTGIFNLASEGAFFMGGVIATIAALKLPLHGAALPVASILLGGLVGMVMMLIPVFVRQKYEASEIVCSLMMNYLLFYFGSFLIRAFVRNPDSGELQSLPFSEDAMLTTLFPGTRIHTGLLVAVVFVVFFWVYLYKSRWGYRMRIVGSNSNFALYSGIRITASVVIAQALAGLACGVGGATEILGMYSAFRWKTAPGPGFGWDGIIVATLARSNPALVPIGAFFLAYLRVGADIMTRMTDVQNEIVSIIQGIVIVLIVAQSFLGGWEKKAIFKAATANANAKEKEGQA